MNMRRNRVMTVRGDDKLNDSVNNVGMAEEEGSVMQTNIDESDETPIDGFDDLLYEIGLCLTSVRERPKRRAINNPIVVMLCSDQ